MSFAKTGSAPFSSARGFPERVTSELCSLVSILRYFWLASIQDTEQSLNNSLPNTREQQGLIRATGTKNPRAQLPALRC